MTDKLKMVKKGGKKVPFYAADGVGKMQSGGMARNPLARARRGIKKQGGLQSQAGAGRAAFRKGSRRGPSVEEAFGVYTPSRKGSRKGPSVQEAVDRSGAYTPRTGALRNEIPPDIPTVSMRDAEGGSMMRDQFQQGQRQLAKMTNAERRSKQRSGPGMFGDRRLGGMFSGNRARRGGLRPSQRAVMQGIGVQGPRGIREGGLVKIASEKSNAKTRKMERRGYGAARKP